MKCKKCNIITITKKNKSGLCSNCKSNIPSKKQLEKDIVELKTRVAVGKRYGVTDNCIKKWLKKYNI